MSETWKTAITNIKTNEVLLRGYPVNELMGRMTFAQTVYLTLKGELPDKNTGLMLDAILVSSIDHGVTPPSAVTAMTVASTGAALNSALAAGILSISRWHGGAIEEAMIVFNEIVEKAESAKISIGEAAKITKQEYKAANRKISGFGHRVHTKDPRSTKMFEIARELKIAGKFVEAADALAAEFQNSGKTLPLNVDGAIAAILCELNFPAELANAFFIMARIPGLTAHIYEEWSSQKPMRKIDINNWEYDGPATRHLSDDF